MKSANFTPKIPSPSSNRRRSPGHGRSWQCPSAEVPGPKPTPFPMEFIGPCKTPSAESRHSTKNCSPNTTWTKKSHQRSREESHCKKEGLMAAKQEHTFLLTFNTYSISQSNKLFTLKAPIAYTLWQKNWH